MTGPVPYTIAAIPTEYKGTLYRSRLEARWAAFFRLLGWRFQYEPRDFGRWSPDFLLLSSRSRGVGIYVEVKPVTEFDPVAAKKMARAVPPDEHTLVMLLGVSPFLLAGASPDDEGVEWQDTGAGIGWGAATGWPPTVAEIDWTPIYVARNASGRFDLYDGQPPGSGALTLEPQALDETPPWGWLRDVELLRDTWAKAGNAVQWKGRS